MGRFLPSIRRFIFVLLLVSPLADYAQEGVPAKPTAAVLDFSGLGITAMEAVTLTQRLAGELVKTEALIMVERGQMNEIMEEQGFQQSGCTSAECAAEIGALLGVQEMIAGSFGKVGNTYTIEAKMFSVESGQTMKAVNRTYKGEVDGLLTQVELVAWELVGLEPPDDLKQRAGMQVEAPPEVAAAVEEKPKKEKKRGGFGRLLRNVVVLGAIGAGGYYYYLTTLEEGELPEPPGPPERSQKMRMGSWR